MLIDSKLFTLRRGGVDEVVVRGEVIVHDGKRVIFQTGDAIGDYPARSLLKPFQFFAANLPEEKWAKQQETNRYIPCVGSVSATEEQTEALKRWYQGPSFKKHLEKLSFIKQYPMDEAHRSAIKARHLPPEVFHHSCFSKHMAILESCELNDWPLENYSSPSHPYHDRLCQRLSELLPESKPNWPFVEDGCGLPSPVLFLEEMAALYQKLAASKEETVLGKIRALMLKAPQWIGGPGRVDTELMELNPARVIAKEGAEGLLALGILPNATYQGGLGIVVKISAGYLPSLAALAIESLLKSLGIKGPGRVPRGHSIRFHYAAFEKRIPKYWDISPVVKKETVVWPNDTSFRRTVSMDVREGSHLTLSKIETTLHLGAHADAPNHFLKEGGGIDTVEVASYGGLCQLVEISKPQGGPIGVADLEEKKIRAKRILIRTNSFPNGEKFNENFAFLTPDAIRYLRACNVCLVGVDTPSLDRFDSKTMEAHRATMESKMAILEGLLLEAVEEGVYELSAFPLKLKEADASPVRALLWEV